MSSFIELALLSVVTLLPIVNPFSTAPLFLAITEGHTPEARREQGRKGVLFMVAILGTFLLAGTLIMSFFGISLPGVRIAGGILVGRVAFQMLYPPEKGELTEDETRETMEKKDISFFPLAMPSLSGPGSIAVTISLATLANNWWDYLAIFLGIVMLGGMVLVTLRLSGNLTRLLGVNGMHAMTKIMGFLIFCLAIQFIVTGVTDPEIVGKFREAWGG